MSIEASHSAAGLRIEHVFDVRLDFHERHIFGPVSGGAKQGYVSVKTGVIEGPRLNGKVVDYSGADWGTVRTDGVVELNAHYLFQADDGALIYIRNQGYVYGTSPAQPGGPPSQGYFRCTPYFRAPEGPHAWLNRTVIIGTGERRSNPDHSVIRYFAVL